MVILQVHFDYTGGYGEEMYKECEALAKSIVAEPGFIWKIWTENETKGIAGGIYAFKDMNHAEKYAKMHIERLEKFGIASNFKFEFFNTNEQLNNITKSPLEG